MLTYINYFSEAFQHINLLCSTTY